MTNREFFITRWEAEQPAFIKVLRAIPEGQLAYKPHERSSASGALAWQLAEEQKQLCELLDTGEINFEIRSGFLGRAAPGPRSCSIRPSSIRCWARSCAATAMRSVRSYAPMVYR